MGRKTRFGFCGRQTRQQSTVLCRFASDCGAFGLLSQVMPGSAAITGVVSRASFDGVVAGVERVRETIKRRNGQQITAELADTIDGLLREERSRDDVQLIRERRHRIKGRGTA